MNVLTVARDLQRRRARDRREAFIAEGIRTVEELLESAVKVQGVLLSPTLVETQRGAALRARLVYERLRRGFELAAVSDAELASVSDMETPQGVLVIAEQPERSFDMIQTGPGTRLLFLDGVQDPGNVGTILRTAEAFGITATIALPGTADLWNPKVVRAAMGTLFRHHAFSAPAETGLEFCAEHAIPLWTTSAAGEPLERASGARGSLAIVVGNEGSGVSQQLAAAAQRSIAIPVRGVESLNVAVATGILLYALNA